MNSSKKIFSWSLHNWVNKDPLSIDFENCFMFFTDFGKKLNLNPTHIGISGRGYPKNKVLPFSHGINLLTSNQFKKLNSITLYSNNGNNDFAFYSELICSISCSSILGTHLYLGINMDYLENPRLLEIDALISLCQMANPAIGYGFVSFPEDGPFGYSKGFIHTPINDRFSEIQKELISTWARDQDLISEGKMRDLYQYNIITDLQLNRKINEQKLKDWIDSSATHGMLTQLTEKYKLWQVPNDGYISARDYLGESDSLISYNKSVLPTILF